ncbi:MAG: cation:proton antiporter [Actinomycetota bacterium]
MVAALTPSEVNVHVLIALAIIIAAARIAGWAISKIGQPRVHGEILGGILMGPSLLGVVWPEALDYLFPDEVIGALKVLATIGLVLFMFLIGLELDLGKLRGSGSKAVAISQASIVLPVALGALLAVWLYPRLGEGVDRLGFSLFLGAAMAITAFPVLARVLQETGLYNTRLGVLTITCAAVDDVTAWCMLAGVVAVINATGAADALQILGWSVLFVVGGAEGRQAAHREAAHDPRVDGDLARHVLRVAHRADRDPRDLRRLHGRCVDAAQA